MRLYVHVYYAVVAVALGNRRGWGTKKTAASFAKSNKKTGHKSKVDRHSTGAHQKAATLGKFTSIDKCYCCSPGCVNSTGCMLKTPTSSAYNIQPCYGIEILKF